MSEHSILGFKWEEWLMWVGWGGMRLGKVGRIRWEMSMWWDLCSIWLHNYHLLIAGPSAAQSSVTKLTTRSTKNEGAIDAKRPSTQCELFQVSFALWLGKSELSLCSFSFPSPLPLNLRGYLALLCPADFIHLKWVLTNKNRNGKLVCQSRGT